MRPIPSLHLLAICLSLGADFSPSSAQAPTGTITGTIVDEEKGWPIRGATVYLLGASEETRTQSDFKGRFSFTVPAGKYSGLAVLRPGGEAVHEIQAELPVTAGIEDDLSEVPVPRPPAENPETSPSPPPPKGTDAPPTTSTEPQEGQAPPAPAEPVPPPEAPNLIPVLPPQSQPRLQPQTQRPGEIRAWLGIYMQDAPLQTDPSGQPSQSTVVKVLKVFQGSPAERAQIREGDVLVTMDGLRLTNVQDLQTRLAEFRPGMKPQFLLMREGAFLETVVMLEEITDSMMQSLQSPPNPSPQAPAPSPNPAGVPDPSAGFPPGSQPSVPAQPQSFPPGSVPPQGGPGQPGDPQVPPLIQEARQHATQGLYLQASEKYDEHLRQFPNDGRAAAEQSEMVFLHIQNARGMALMSQAVKKQGLTVPEKTRLRMIIAQRRFESGNLITAKQMLIEALREDPGNPDVNMLLDIIYQIEAAAQAQQVPLGPGHPKTELEIHLQKEFGRAVEDLFDR